MTSDIQAVLDMAAELTEGTSDETQMDAIVPLGRFQDLQNMVYQWRAAGGKTSDEMDAVIDPVCGSGNIYVTPQAVIDLIRTEVSFRPCQSCHCPEWLHDGGPCCGQNKADTGGCDCKAFVPVFTAVCATCGHGSSSHFPHRVKPNDGVCVEFLCVCKMFVPRKEST